MKTYPLKDKGNGILGIQVKCPKHSWQRTVYIRNGIGCSYCYTKNQTIINIKRKELEELNET